MLMILAMRSLLLVRRALTALAREQPAWDMMVSISSGASPYDYAYGVSRVRRGRYAMTDLLVDVSLLYVVFLGGFTGRSSSFGGEFGFGEGLGLLHLRDSSSKGSSVAVDDLGCELSKCRIRREKSGKGSGLTCGFTKDDVALGVRGFEDLGRGDHVEGVFGSLQDDSVDSVDLLEPELRQRCTSRRSVVVSSHERVTHLCALSILLEAFRARCVAPSVVVPLRSTPNSL